MAMLEAMMIRIACMVFSSVLDSRIDTAGSMAKQKRTHDAT